MRRELAGRIEPPHWPQGVAVRTLGPRPERSLLEAAHAVLGAGFWEGGGGAPEFRRWWKGLRNDPEFDPALVFIAADARGVAGLAHCWTSAFVKDLVVHPRARRCGIGRALVLTAFHALAQRGMSHVDLKVRAENEPAIALYKTVGMRVVGAGAIEI